MVLNGDPKGKNMLYCNGKSVIIRDIENPGISDTYTQHSVQATAACYAPSGFYIASGDNSGKIRIWDTTQKEHILKYEYQPISGKIKDICWSPDSKRIAVCGEGRENYAVVFLWDSGSTVGNISGHSKFINNIAYRPTRPFRVVTAGEDNTVGFYEGPPFKLKSLNRDHTRFVNTIRYSPDGEFFCSGGADMKAHLFNGKDGTKISCLEGHKGGIYALSFGPDSKQVLTASGDKTCKLWDLETSQVVTEFKMGSEVLDQQVGCLWQGSYLLSVSLSGYINYLDVNDPSKPCRIVPGQNKNLTSLAVSSDSSSLYAGSFDGRITHWDIETGNVEMVAGKPHTNSVEVLEATPDRVYSLGLDKSLRTINPSSNEFDLESLGLPDRDPTGLATTSDGYAVVTTKQEVVVAKNLKRVSAFTPSFEPCMVAINCSNQDVVIGGTDNSVHVYELTGDNLKEKKTFEVTDQLSDGSFSPDGQSLILAVGKKLKSYNAASYDELKTFYGQTARIMSVAWSPDSSMLVSAGIDTNMFIWDAASGEKKDMVKGAHPLAVISTVTWINQTTIATCGHDCCIRIWEFSA